MGFVKEQKVLNLVWEPGHEYHGLEVKATSVSLGEFLKIANMAKVVQSEQADAGEVSRLFQTFALSLVSWNLEERKLVDGELKVVPVPATVDGLYAQDFDFAMSMINAWMSGVAQVQESEGKGSGSGGQFPEGSIPMEPK